MPTIPDHPYWTLTPDERRASRIGRLANTMTGLGAGISQTGAAGQPRFSGVAPAGA